MYSGTTCKVGIFRGPNLSEHHIVASKVIDTKHPDETVAEICKFFNDHHELEYSSMGVGAFGPICLDKTSP